VHSSLGLSYEWRAPYRWHVIVPPNLGPMMLSREDARELDRPDTEEWERRKTAGELLAYRTVQPFVVELFCEALPVVGDVHLSLSPSEEAFSDVADPAEYMASWWLALENARDPYPVLIDAAGAAVPLPRFHGSWTRSDMGLYGAAQNVFE